MTNKKRKRVSGMGVARRFAACAVYQEKIVVIGGTVIEVNRNLLNIVDSYDVVADKWSKMPNMV